MKSRWLLWGLGGLLLVGAGVATAYFVNRRDVTTSSQAAYEAYQEGVTNEGRFYTKEARVGYARALELDPNFAMAMLGLSRVSSDQDQGSALVKRAAKEKGRLTERERLHVELDLSWRERKPEATYKIARELHEKYPDDVRAATMLAREQLQKGNSDQAIKIFEELLAIDPNNAEAYNQIGYYYGYRGEYEKAIENLQKYQFIASDTANPFDSLGEVQAYSGRYNEAIENLNRALAIKSDFMPSYHHLGVAYEGMGEYGKAIENYRKAAEFADNDGMRMHYFGSLLRAAFIAGDLGVVEEARTRARKLPKSAYSEVDSGFVDAAVALANGRAAEAEKSLAALEPQLKARYEELLAKEKHASPRKPHFPGWNLLMGMAKEKQGKLEEAMALYAANANPPNPFRDFEERRFVYEGRAAYAALLARKGDLDRAEKLIAENRKWNPSWAPCRESETAVAELRRAKVLAAAR